MTCNCGLILENYRIRHDFKRPLNFEIHVVDHCNLKCKYCSHFSPVATPYFIESSLFESDLSILHDIVNQERIDKIRILGGEPLLHPEIPSLLEIAYKYFPGTRRELVTNGLLLNTMGKDFWEACKTTDTHIYVSRYPINVNYEEVRKILESHRIKHIVVCVPKSFDRHPLSLQGRHHRLLHHVMCKESYGPYMQVSHGRLYKCPYSAYVHHLNNRFKTDFRLDPNDSIDLYSVKSIKDIYRFLCRPIGFCGYCKLGRNSYQNKWEYSQEALDEWAEL